MRVTISTNILERLPNACIGFFKATVNVQSTNPWVEQQKVQLAQELESYGLDATNFAAHPDVSVWRELYGKAFGVKPKQYRSSIESLLRRVLRGNPLWNISNVVDLYNCCSLRTLLPMGAYDLQTVTGDIVLRYGKDGDEFLGIGEKTPQCVSSQHIVYADDDHILCWLWNHRDAQHTRITPQTKEAIFFVDALLPESHSRVTHALEQLAKGLEVIGSQPGQFTILDTTHPEGELS